jgi:tellurite resistance protein
MAQFNLGDVLGSVLGGGRARRTRRRGGNQDLGRALAVLAGVAIEAMSRPSQPAPAPPPRRGAGGAWGEPAPAKAPPTGAPSRKPAPVRGSVPSSGPWGAGMPPGKPPPSDAWSPVPGTPAPPAIPAEDREGLLMLRAMVAAARADGQVDAEERARIADQLDAAGLSPVTRDAVLAEFDRGAAPEELAREARDPMLAAQLYAAAVAGAGSVEGAERAWLDGFAKALRLDRAATEAIERRIRGG